MTLLKCWISQSKVLTPRLRCKIINFLILKSATLEFSVIATESILVDLSGVWVTALIQ